MLESTLAFHHTEMTQSATIMIARYSNDSTGVQLDSMRFVWQQIRTTAARYAEALSLMEGLAYDQARAVVEAIPQEHQLKPKELTERDKMLTVIDLLIPVFASGRSEAELSLAEQDQLEQLTYSSFDRAAIWGQNLLCFHYQRCRPPFTGGDDGEPKSLPQVQLGNTSILKLRVAPNPSSSWVEISYIAIELISGSKAIATERLVVQ